MNILQKAAIVAICALPVTAQAAIGPGQDNRPWKAWADTPNSSGHSGIVVTDVTYQACVAQFQNAMNSHASAHGDVFTNIHYCHYKPAGAGIFGGEALNQLSRQIAELESGHAITKFEEKKALLLEDFYKNLEELPVKTEPKR